MSILTKESLRPYLKTVYLSGVANAKEQGSTVLGKVKKETWDFGEKLQYVAQYTNGGNFGVNYSAIVGSMDEGALAEKWTATPGHLTGVFSVSQPEILETASERASFMKAIAANMSSCFDGIAKDLATYMYVGKDGVIGKVISASGSTITVDRSVALKLGLGRRFRVVSSLDDYATAAVLRVAAKSKGVITYAVVSGSAPTITAGDLIVYNAKGVNVSGPDGLADLIPATRDSSTKDFRGVDRSKAWENLAGQCVETEANADGAAMAQALVDLLKDVTMAGGTNVSLIINNEDYDTIAKAIGINQYYWLGVNTGDSKNRVTKGLSSLAVAFGDAFTGNAIIDPYCPKGKAYMISMDDFTFYALNGVDKVINPVSNDQLGKYDVESVGDAGLGDNPHVQLNLDKLFTISEGAADELGPTFNVAAHLYGNFVIRDTAACGVAVFN
jgi:hypothetical protein